MAMTAAKQKLSNCHLDSESNFLIFWSKGFVAQVGRLLTIYLRIPLNSWSPFLSTPLMLELSSCVTTVWFSLLMHHSLWNRRVLCIGHCLILSEQLLTSQGIETLHADKEIKWIPFDYWNYFSHWIFQDLV